MSPVEGQRRFQYVQSFFRTFPSCYRTGKIVEVIGIVFFLGDGLAQFLFGALVITGLQKSHAIEMAGFGMGRNLANDLAVNGHGFF